MRLSIVPSCKFDIKSDCVTVLSPIFILPVPPVIFIFNLYVGIFSNVTESDILEETEVTLYTLSTISSVISFEPSSTLATRYLLSGKNSSFVPVTGTVTELPFSTVLPSTLTFPPSEALTRKVKLVAAFFSNTTVTSLFSKIAGIVNTLLFT